MRCQKQSKRQMRAGAFPRELRASGPVLTHPMEQLTGGVCCQERSGAGARYLLEPSRFTSLLMQSSVSVFTLLVWVG